jgi:NitT/TauT family transport system substrate-binding protein
MLYSDYGLVNYGTTVMTQPQRVSAEPQLCAAFIDGLMEALKFTMLDPEEALNIFLKQVPELALAPHARDEARVGVGIMIYTVARDIVRQHGLGYIEPKDYDTMADMVMQYLANPGDPRPDVTQLMTNQFVGGIKLSPTEWETAQKNAAEFRAYLS